MTFLAVDDDLDILNLIEIILTEEGHQVVTATTGSEFFQKLQNTNPDKIILDFNLPDMQSDQIVAKLQAQSQTQHIPIVLISSQSDTVSIADNSTAVQFLNKPFCISEFCTVARA